MPPLPSESWQLIDSVFHQALDLPVEKRDAFLDQACAGNRSLRNEVSSLLASADRELDFVEQPLRAAAEQIADDRLGAGSIISGYRLVRVLGEGGMGTVYLGERADQQFHKQVAIKLLQPYFVQTAAMQVRFKIERQILATLEHPNIARLLDGGVTRSGIPYLVMEYVDGIAIDQYRRQRALTIEQCLRLFCTVCTAVESAHKNLVVHRDIKPANILVNHDGVPKLLDFGIAKLLAADGTAPKATLAADRMMTPEYASPEQIRGDAITTATDVYALGVLLYELLTGVRPFSLKSYSPGEFYQAVCEKEAEAPSARIQKGSQRRINNELDNIVLMAMRKEPDRRYRSVREFADDIDHYLNGYPVRAKTSSWNYRVEKFLRRHKLAVSAVAFAIICLVGATIGMALMARRAQRQQTVAMREKEFLASVFRASSPEESRGHEVSARDLLDRGVQRIDRELAGQPELQADMLDSIGRSYTSLSLYDRAEPLMDRAYGIRRRIYGDDNLATADTADGLANVLRLENRNEEAEKLFRQTLAVRQRQLSANDDLVAQSLTHLGDCLIVEGKYGEAEVVLRRALAIDRAHSQDQGADARNFLALVLENQGNFGEAGQLLREAVEISKRTLGADSPDYALALHNLAGSFIDMGDLSDAEATDRRCLDLWRRELGDDHLNLVYPLNNLAWIKLEEGRPQDAEAFLRQDIAIIRKHNSINSIHYASAISNWGRMLQEREEYAGAESSYREALKLINTLFGAQSFQAAKVLAYLGEMKFDQRHYSSAERYAKQALEIRRQLGGQDHPLVASSLLDLAAAEIMKEHPDAAEAMLRQAIAIREKRLSATHPAVLLAEARLGELLVARGRAEEAEPMLRQALASAKAEAFAVVPWQLGEIERALGLCLRSRYQSAESERLLRQAKLDLRDDPCPAFRTEKAPGLAFSGHKDASD